MSYYQSNRQEILQKAKEKYSKEKAATYYLKNKEVIKEKSINRYRNLSEEEKNKIKEYQKKKYQELIQYKKEALKAFFIYSIIMSEKTLKFNNIKINKKGFHKSKQAIDLDSVTTDKIVVSDKFRHSEEGYKYFIGYQENEIVKPLCIILPIMNGYIKHFENGGKNMSFVIKNDEVWQKYLERHLERN